MKPKTKLQFDVFDRSKRLENIDDAILNWAKEDCLDHTGYSTKNRVICMDCGEKFSSQLVVRKRAICQHCGRKLVIEQTRASTNKQHIFVAKAEIVGDYQVIRNFEIFAHHKVGQKARYTCWEILQHWVITIDKREVVSRQHNTNWYQDSWSGNLEIRDKGTRKYWESNPHYDVYPKAYHPQSVFRNDCGKYGIDKGLQEFSFIEALRIIPNEPKAETLLKAKQFGLLGLFTNGNGSNIRNHWESIKIVLRNKYKVKDGSMYIDYLNLLSYFKKDLRNAHYVCPKNLKAAHDIYMKRKKKVMAHEEMKRDYLRTLQFLGEYDKATFYYPKNLGKEYRLLVERKKVVELERKQKLLDELKVKYEKFIQHFIDMQIQDKLIRIVPLQTVEEFKLEGETMHHCVYSNEYFKKNDCLILSARIEDKRLATIEINLKSMKMVQCRGEYNKVPEHYERIQRLVNKNIKQIQKRFELNQAV